MAKEYSTFKYPLWLTGIWMPEIQRISVLVGIAILIAGACVLWLRQLGLWIAVFFLGVSAVVLVTPMIGKMARYMSIADHFPFGNTIKPRVMLSNLPQAIMLLFCNIAGPVLCLWLMRPEDSILIRLVRIISIEFIVLIISMVIGGAIACSHAEGKKGIESIRRMLHLVFCQRGHFSRAAVYGLPLCLVLFSIDMAVLFGAAVLPFLISHYALSFWFLVLSPATSLLVRIVRVVGLIIVGLLLAGLLFLSIQKPKEFKLDLNLKWRLALVVAFFSTVWIFWVMPLLCSYSSSFPNQSPFANWLAYLKMATPTPVPIALGLCFVYVGILWFLAKLVGRWFFLYPLAYGVFTFFHLRQEAEGTPHRSPSDPTVATRRSSLSGLGGNLFKTGSFPSVLHDIRPPRGWAPLLWIPIAPWTYFPSCVLVIAMMFCNYPVASLHGIWRVFWLCTSSLTLAIVFFPIISRSVIRYLLGNEEGGLLTGYLVRRTAVILLTYIAILFIFPVIIAIGGSLAMVPIIGSVLWAVLYAIYLIPCGQLVAQVLLFLPLGMLMLPPMVANKTDAKYKFLEQVERLGKYIDELMGPFLGIALCGLFVSGTVIAVLVASLFLISQFHIGGHSTAGWCNAFCSVLGVIPFFSLSPLHLIVVIGVCGLCISAFNTAITNAYLTVRGLIK